MTVPVTPIALSATENTLENSFAPPPQDWPATIVVTEISPSREQRDRAMSGPYREPARSGVSGLRIAWNEDRYWVRLGLGAWCVIWTAMVVVVWIVGPHVPLLWGVTAVPILSLWIARLAWNEGGFVRADHEGLHWQVASWNGRVDRHLAGGDVAQLFVCDTTDHSYEGEGIVFPSFTVYVRDRGGREHALASFESARQARWLEYRLESHLRKIDDASCGEQPHSGV